MENMDYFEVEFELCFGWVALFFKNCKIWHWTFFP